MENDIKKIVLYTHNTGGDSHWDSELFYYLLDKKYEDLIKIDFPFGKNSVKPIRSVFYKNCIETIRFESILKFSTPDFLSYIKDFLYGLFYGFRFLKNTDLFFGMDNLLTIIGLFFKKIGLVKKVAYVVVDYSPIRYSNKFLDKLYYFIDKICLYNSDYVLPLSKEMIDGRIKDKKLDKNLINYIVCPSGNHSLKNNENDYANNVKNIVYFGSISRNKGIELFIPIVKKIIEKGIVDFKFNIIGGGDIKYLKNEIEKNDLEQYFKIYGRIEKNEDIDSILLTCGIAIAPYPNDDENSFSYYADPGKIKIYFGAGLPVILTDVPPIAKIINDKKCGFISKYESNDFSDKIIELMSNDNLYFEYRKNAIDFGRIFDWENIFNNFFNKINNGHKESF